MFSSFFPRPTLFFSSAALWCAFSVLIWFGGGENVVHHLPFFAGDATAPPPDNGLRFIAPAALGFYLYYLVAAGLFTAFWFIYSTHPWQRWSVAGSALIVFIT